MAEQMSKSLIQGPGAILTEKRRKLLFHDDIDGVTDTTVRRHRSEIRKRFIDALIDLQIIADQMRLSDMEELAKAISREEEEHGEPIFGPALSSMVAIGWICSNKRNVEDAVSLGVEMAESREAPYYDAIATGPVATAIEFGPGASYNDPIWVVADYLENPDEYGPEETALLEKTIEENPEVVEAIRDSE